VLPERPVTTTGLAKVRVVGVTVRLGLAVEPVTVVGGRVVPVRRTVRPWSRMRVAASEEGAVREL